MKLLKKYLRKWLLKDFDYNFGGQLNVVTNSFEVEKIQVEEALPIDVPQHVIDQRLNQNLLDCIEKHIKTETYMFNPSHTIFAQKRIRKTIYIAKEKV
jgi:hypothetical protein